MPIVTKQSINQALLANNERSIQYLGRALVALFHHQTSTEQQHNSTLVHNNVGFNGGDAKGGSLTAKYFLKHGTLQQWQVAKWTRTNRHGDTRLAKYHSQLNQIAIAKANAKQSQMTLE